MLRRWRRTGTSAAGTRPAIAGYRELELVGSGGFSKVYTAYQERFARTVAVKLITVELSDDALRRFRREQLTAGQLDGHPHVIRVYESGFTDDGLPYLTMEYHEQGSLADRVRRQGPLPVDEVLSVGVKLACALEAAHRRGIVHRDVKPQNVLLSPFVGPILADFGIAAFDDARVQTTTSEAFSVFHVAPEVLDGHPATPAADLYALVSTLYELLAGRAPFAGDDHDDTRGLGRGGSADSGSGSRSGSQGGLLQYMRRVRTGTVPPIDRPDVPPRVVEELVALMARDPAARPPTALALAERLSALEAELGFPPTPLVGFPSPSSSAGGIPPADAPGWSSAPPPGVGASGSTGSPGAPSSPVGGAGSSPAPSAAGAWGSQVWIGGRDPGQPSDPTPGVTTPVGPPRDGRWQGSGGPEAGVGSGGSEGGGRPADATATFHPGRGRPTPAPPAGEPRRRVPWPALGGVGLMVVLLAAAAWFFLGRDDSDAGERQPGATTTTAAATGALPPCPSGPTGNLMPPVEFRAGQPPTGLQVEVSGDATTATIRWQDPNGGRNPYLVYVLCDTPDNDTDRVVVEATAAGEATEVTVDDLPVDLNYCFTVAVLNPEDRAVAYTAADGTSFLCLDQTTR